MQRFKEGYEEKQNEKQKRQFAFEQANSAYSQEDLQRALQQDQIYLKLIDDLQKLQESYANAETLQLHYQDYVNFLKAVDDSLSILCQLLGSKTPSDVLEAINVIKMMYRSGITGAEAGIKKMLVLMFSNEPAVQKAVVDSYRLIYLDKLDPNGQAKNLINLIKNADNSQIACIEKFIQACMEQRTIGIEV